MKELRIIRITPEGTDAPASRQIVVEFNRPVVPVGRMDRTAAEVGVTITPPVNCQWRWLNTSALSCNLNNQDALQPATTYKITVNPIIRAEDGGKIAAPVTEQFSTERPRSVDLEFNTWRAAAWPVMRVTFNQPVTKSSVAAHLVLEAEQAQQYTRYSLTVSPDPEDQDTPVALRVPGEKKIAVFAHRFHRHINDTPVTTSGGEEARRIWLIEPQRGLPENASFRVSEEPGLVSAAGPDAGEGRDGYLVASQTFASLSFTGVRCFDANGESVIIESGKLQSAPCNPLRGVALRFTAPVLRSQIATKAVFTPDLAGGRKDFHPWGDVDNDESRITEPRAEDGAYDVPLPVGLKAAHTYTVHLPGRDGSLIWYARSWLHAKENPVLEDQFGRPLEQSVTLSFATGHRNPNYELPTPKAVLEKNVDSEVPLYVNNLKSFGLSYSKLTAAGSATGQQAMQKLPQVQDVQFAVPLGVRGLLGGNSGAATGVLTTDPATEQREPEHFFGEVTPWQVHFKLGHFQSLAWVTDLATGAPVAGAKVGVYEGNRSDLTGSQSRGTGTTDADGIAFLPGSPQLAPDPDVLGGNENKPGLFVRIDKGSDMALLPLTYDFAINSWNLGENSPSVSNRLEHGHMRAWGMTAQGVYKAGDTVQYKIFVRDQNNRTLVPPPDAGYSLEITDPTGKAVGTVNPVKLSDFGAYAGEFPVPKNGAVGWYEFVLHTKFSISADDNDDSDENSDDSGTDKTLTLRPLRVLVSDFTPSPFGVTTDLNGDHFRAGDRLDIAAAAKLHSGGAYTDAAVRNTITLRSMPFVPKTLGLEGFQFDSFEGEADSIQLDQKKAVLDAKGESKESFTLPQEKIVYGVLDVEGAVQDDRGKYVASMAHADYAGVDRLVGLKSPSWIYTEKAQASFPTVVVDDHGAPIAGVPVAVTVERQAVSTVKVKGAGNAYLSDTTVNWAPVSKCNLTSAKEPVPCKVTPPMAGDYRLTASIKDTHGVAHTTTMQFWVAGGEYVQWDDHSEQALPVTPEKKEYHVGDTARFLVKNPYPRAEALITTERYGVLSSMVKKLDSAAVIEIPVTPDDIPGFYLSVVVVSPRVAKPLGPGEVDLGKPAFRIGYATITVRDPYKEMAVTAMAAQDVYRPGDTVKVDLTATPRVAPDTKQPVEMAVAVLDESVFDLITGGRDAYDPYKGFYSLDPLDMRNYSLLTRLVGRQVFEKKGANPGGDGGKDVNMRDVFKYVSYWNPSVPVDADGKAHIEFKSPDNLTGWRILALADTPGDRLGLGEASFKVNRPTEIRPVMPNQVREGDSFQAGFSVMNRTAKPRTITVTIAASGDLAQGTAASKTQTVSLAPYQRTSVFLPLQAAMLPITREVPEGQITFKAIAGDAADKDGLDFALPVGKARTFDISATYATTTDDKAQEHIAFPKDIYTDAGDVSVVLSPSVIANLAGAFRYMRDYPFPCWEQKLSRGVMAAHYKALKAYLPASLTWPDADGLPQATLNEAADFQAPNGGMTYFVAQDQYADPYLSAYTALAFRWLRRDGYAVPDEVESRLQAYLQTFLSQNTAPDFYQPGMTSTVRAVALVALADAGKATADDIRRYEPYAKDMSLFGKANLLQAATLVGQTPDIAKELANMIFDAGNETGGKFMFSETKDDSFARILATPLRDNCEILDAFMSYYGKTDEGKELIGDKAFKLMRTITQSRGSRDHWENTQENLFCMNALADYARTYESAQPSMRVDVALDGQSFGQAKFVALTDAPVTVSRPIGKDDPGRTANLDIMRQGDGRLYYAARLRYASTAGHNKAATNAGMDLTREYSVKRDGKWTLLRPDEAIARGDLVRVDLYLSLPAARNFVVVDDPVPGGLEPVNRDLATASKVDADKGEFDQSGGSMWFKFNDWHEYNFARWSFYHEELHHDSARFYADWLEAGNYHLAYTAQAVAEGKFAVPPVHAEEMYDPDIYGTGTDAILTVKGQPRG